MKIYIYPDAKEHAHDNNPGYENLVPLSKIGLKRYCQIVEPENADYFYMGQISDTLIDSLKPKSFKYFFQYQSKHIADIEGDWACKELPTWLHGCILTINGLERRFGHLNAYVRPTFSKVFIDIAKNKFEGFQVNYSRQFGFIGYPDPWGIRFSLSKIFGDSDLKHAIILRGKWNGTLPPEDELAKEYEQNMLNSTFALCPRGMGHDSVRFYEACFFGKVPIIIGDNILPGESYFQTDFAIRINPSEGLCIQQFESISKMSNEEIDIRGRMARKYFEEVIRPYMLDPTGRFIKWLKDKSL